MPVYEATTRPQYRKMVRFIEELPPESLWKLFLRSFIPTNIDGVIEGLKQLKNELRFLYVEDSVGTVRGIFIGEEEGHPRIGTYGFLFMDDDDMKTNEHTYARELSREVARKLLRANISVMWLFARELEKPFLDSVLTPEETDIPPAGNILGLNFYMFRIDLTQFGA